MILPALAAAVAAHFAPPLDRALRYKLVDRSYSPAGEATVETGMTLRFTSGPRGLTATATTDTVAVTAPPRPKHKLEALMTPLIGSATTVSIGQDGTAGAVIDSARSWAAQRASKQALLHEIEGETATPAATLELARANLQRQIDAGNDPVARDDALRPSVAQLLPPGARVDPDKPLRIMTTLPTPGGPLQAASTIALTTAPTRLTYHIETVTLPADAGRPAVTFAETSDIIVDRGTGLMLGLHSHREVRRPASAPTTISSRDIEAQP